MTRREDPRHRFRRLPEPVPSDELVETTDTDRPAPAEGLLDAEWRQALLGPS